MSKPMMKCGHTANAQRMNGTPVCVICLGIRAGADEVAETPDLTGRLARCSCGHAKPSSTGLAFFAHEPAQLTDRFYCGCRGWD